MIRMGFLFYLGVAMLPRWVSAQVIPTKPLRPFEDARVLNGPSFWRDMRAAYATGVQVGGANSLCLADTGRVGPARLGKLRELASSERPSDAELRDSLGGLPRVPAEDVALISDPTICRRAAHAVAELYGWKEDQPLYVARTSLWYAAFPVGPTIGEWAMAIYLDREFRAFAVSGW
jgi:hypothetical protein